MNGCRVYCAFLDFAIVTGEIQRNLFSATAHRSSQSDRMQHIEGFAARLKAIQASVQSVRTSKSLRLELQENSSRYLGTVADIP